MVDDCRDVKFTEFFRECVEELRDVKFTELFGEC